jgi:hypothetical protein
MMIEVFSTNVETPAQAACVIDELVKELNDVAINFDLADCDKVLRIAGKTEIDTDIVVVLVRKLGFNCELLSDQVCDFESAFA